MISGTVQDGESVVVSSDLNSLESAMVCSVGGIANEVVTSEFTISGNETAFIAGYGDLTWSDFKTGYCGFYYQDSSVIDAEKCTAITQDNMMCWAGTAANMLYYTGWGLVGTDTEDKVFSVFIDNFTLGKTYGGNAYHAIDWYFTGHYSPKTWSEWDIPLENSGGFYSETFKTENLSSYLTSTTFTVSGLTTAKQKLEAGYGVGVTFGYYDSKGTRTGGHLITLWGVTCDSSYSVTDPRYYTGIIVTDSDDNKSVSDPLSAPDTLKIISISYDSSLGAYLIDPDYAGANSRLEHLTFLAPNAYAYAVPDDAGPVNVYSGNILVKKGTVLTGETIVSGTNDSMFVSSGGTANSTTVSSGGAVYVRGGGFANVVTVSSGGTIYIYGELYAPTRDDYPVELPGSARGVTVSTGGSAFISGGEVDGLMVSSGAYASVAGCDGVIGRLFGGAVKYGGTFTIGDCTEFWGSTVFGGTVTVNGWANVYGELNFDLSERSAADTYIVDDITGLNLSDGSCYTISVSDNQANGTYKLAGNASSFSDTITIEGESLTVNGTGVTIDGKQYTLAVTDSILTLTIGAAVPTGDQVKVYSSGTLVKQGTVLTGETIVGGANNSMFVYDGGTAKDTAVNSGGYLNVSKGGMAYDTTINSGGEVRVFSGGVANDTTVSSGGELRVSFGGTVNDTTVNSWSYLYVSSGGKADSAAVNSWGRLYVSRSGSANDITVNSLGGLDVFSGGTATNIVAHSGTSLGITVAANTYIQGTYGGSAFETADGYISGYTVYAGGYLYVYGTANDTTVNTRGTLRVRAGGMANDTTVNSSGSLEISGTANSTVVNSSGYLCVSSGGMHKGVLNIAPEAFIYVIAGGIIDFTVSEWNTTAGYLINDLSLIQGTPAYTITVNADQAAGTYKLAQGASNFTQTVAIGTETVNYGSITANGADFVYNGVAYSLDQVAGNLTLTIGAAVPAGDQVKVYSSGTLVKQGKVLTGETIVGGANNSMFVYSGGTANSTTVNSSGWLHLSSGGVANSTTVNSGNMRISGGVANSTTVTTSGGMWVSGGVANSTTVTTSGGMWVSCGVANNTTVNTSGMMCVYSDGVANSTTVNSEGLISIHSDGVANSTTVNSGGSIFISSDGVANSTTVNTSGTMWVFSDGVANSTTVNSSGWLRLSSGGVANSTTVNSSGWLHLSSGGVANDTVVNSAGSMYISNGGKHRLTLTMEGGAVVSAFEGGIVDFTVSEWNTTAGYLINDLSLIQGTPAYTITVNADQAAGTYKLAQGASNFTQTVAIGTETVNYGSITANGADFVYNGVTYSLDQVAGNLTLTIGAAVPTGDQVQVYSSGTLVKQGTVLTGETIVGGANNSMFVYSGGTAHLTTVDSRGNMHVSQGGSANETLIKYNGSMIVSKGGFAENTSGHDGSMIVWGTASNTTLQDCTMTIWDGGVARSVTASGHAKIYVSSGGLLDTNSIQGRYNGNGWYIGIGVVRSGGYACNNTVGDFGGLHIENGGSASSTTVNRGGGLTVSGGGFAEDVAVYSSGRCTVIGEEYTPEGGEMVEALYGSAKNVTVYSGGTATVSGGEVSGLLVSSGGIASVCGVADVSAVDVYGKLYSAEVKSGGTLTIGSGGVELWEDTVLGGTVTVNSWANVYGELNFDLSERTVDDIYIVDDITNLYLDDSSCYTISVSENQANGTYKLAGNAANFNESISIDGTALSVNGAGVTIGDKQYTLAVTDSILTLTIGAAVPTGDQVQVYSSGTLVKQGTVLTGETIVGGANNSMFVYNGGSACDTIISSGGSVMVSSGGRVSNTVLRGGKLRVNSGAVAVSTFITSNGREVNLFPGGTISGLDIQSGGRAFLRQSSVATGITASSGAILGFDVARQTLFQGVYGGKAFEVKDGKISGYEINSGCHVSVCNGGTALNIEVLSGGLYAINDNGIHRQTLHINAGAVVSAYQGSTVDFTVSARSVSDGYLINDLSLIQGTPTYTITVNADQAAGTYKLAQGASNFTQTVAIGTETVNYGSITANGADFVYNGVTYSLDQVAGNLTLTIGTAIPPVPVGDQVKVYSSGTLVKQGKVLTGETIVGGANNSMFVFSGGTANSTTVNSFGNMYVSGGGSAASVWVTSGGTIYIYGEEYAPTRDDYPEPLHGIARGVTVSSGGSALISGGEVTGLMVSSGGYASVTGVEDTSAVDVNCMLFDGEIKYGGTFTIGNRTELWGTVFGGTVIVNGWAYVHDEVVFDLSERSAADTYIVDDITGLNLTEFGSYTISVSENQANGTYKLAGNASSFSDTITVAGESLTVNGTGVTIGSKQYTLAVTDSILTLTIGAADQVPPVLTISGNAVEWTNKDVVLTVECDDKEASVSYRVNGGSWQNCSGSVTVSANCTIEFKAVDAAGNAAVETVVVDRIDKMAPTAPVVTADVTGLTNSNVTLTADFGDAVTKEYSFNSRTWYTYTGSVVLSSNSSVYFRGTDHVGNVSEISSYKVDNIDKKAPGIPGNITFAIDKDSVLVDWADAADNGPAGTKGYYFRYGNSANLTGTGTFSSVSNIQLEDLAVGTWYFQIAAVDSVGNISQWSTVQNFEILPAGPENPVGDADGLKWDAVPGAKGYVVEYSTDDFATVISVETPGNSLDSFALPETTFKWRVRALEDEAWSYGNEITGKDVSGADKLVSDRDGVKDLFFANAEGVWEDGFAAQHLGSGSWQGTWEKVYLAGKNKMTDIFEGSSDASVLVLTDDSNGDALFVDDIYSALGTSARLTQISEIRAGAGDDIVDMTSQRYEYSGSSIRICGGDGNDTIWGAAGSNALFGDRGNDRLVGGSGNDVIAGGAGNDSMHGGGGDDIFTFGGNWGNDVVEQYAAGSVTLYLGSGVSGSWNADTRTWSDGINSIRVVGTENISIKFYETSEISESGAFEEQVSRKIFEDSGSGFIA